MASVVGVFVTGASSTGKTTLCEALKRRLEENGMVVFHITEVARTVMREQGFSRETVGTIEMQKAIMLAQIKAETNAIEEIKSHPIPSSLGRPKPFVLLCDRCAIDPVVYATMHLEPNLVEELTGNPFFQTAVTRYRDGQMRSPSGTGRPRDDVDLRPVVILTDGVEEWKEVDDGVRSLYDPWKVTAFFRQVLQGLDIQHNILGYRIKDIGQRVEWTIDTAGLRRSMESTVLP
jgi:nicotinamide riboside kinase